MDRQYTVTSESVSEGHPDKVADKCSDAIVDAILAQDPQARTACEVLVSTGLVLVSGEVSTEANVDYSEIIRRTVLEIGYDKTTGFDGNSCAVLVAIDKQSPDIAQGVNEGSGLDVEQGAGDQGMVYGYASNETPTLMPMPIQLAHRLVEQQAKMRKSGELQWLGPDAKSQVSVRYEGHRPQIIDTVVLSTQHDAVVDYEEIKQTVIKKIIQPVLPPEMINDQTQYLVNPTGRFVIGGPMGDCGLTGRKVIVDTYGGVGRHGGGAFSGKDPSKVDRSAAYAARYVAKNIVAAGLADKCEVQISYAIGIAHPISIYIDTFGTGKIADATIEKRVVQHFDLRPKGIIEMLDLLRPIYGQTAAYGHFGRELDDFSWEKTDKAEILSGSD